MRSRQTPHSTQLPAKPLAPALSQRRSGFCPAVCLSSLASNSPRLFGSRCRLEPGPCAWAACAQRLLVCHLLPRSPLACFSNYPPCPLLAPQLHHGPSSLLLHAGGISTARKGPPPGKRDTGTGATVAVFLGGKQVGCAKSRCLGPVLDPKALFKPLWGWGRMRKLCLDVQLWGCQPCATGICLCSFKPPWWVPPVLPQPLRVLPLPHSPGAWAQPAGFLQATTHVSPRQHRPPTAAGSARAWGGWLKFPPADAGWGSHAALRRGAFCSSSQQGRVSGLPSPLPS